MITNKYIEQYFNYYDTNKILLNSERVLLIDYLKRDILTRDDLYFNEEQIDAYIEFSEKYYFPLDDWEKFIAPFIFLYFKDDDEVYFDIFFLTMGRGAGKNGFISTLGNFLISPLYNVPDYHITIVANNEEQAKTSFEEVYNAIKRDDTLLSHFSNGKAKIESYATNSVLKFATSNASTKDGGRQGAIFYDEIHEMENDDIVNVFSGGLGKVANAREFFISTNGFVREGYYDKLLERSMKVLNGESNERIFPFICKLDDIKELDNPEMWEKSNPLLVKPLNSRAKRLFRKIKLQYEALEETPSSRVNFVTKRMNFPETDLETSVASWDEILKTNRPIPDLQGQDCIGGLDFGSIRDFASVGLLFRDIDDNYIWLTHSFARKEYLDKAKLKPPIHEWEQDGLLTIVDEPSINPKHIVDWFVRQSKSYNIQTIIADNFRMDLLRPLFEEVNLNIEVVKNPRAIHSLLAPRIEDAFANERIVFGDNPLMRWYTNNVYVKVKKDGNKEYLKKDEHRRKTDGFQAFVHAMYRADMVVSYDYGDKVNSLNSLNF